MLSSVRDECFSKSGSHVGEMVLSSSEEGFNKLNCHGGSYICSVRYREKEEVGTQSEASGTLHLFGTYGSQTSVLHETGCL